MLGRVDRTRWHPVNAPSPSATEPLRAGLRHVAILFSDIAGFSEWTQKLGDLEASRIAGKLLALQEIIITRDGAGRVLHFGGDSVFAVFDTPSAALNRALEIQRVLASTADAAASGVRLRVRLGLHMGEVLVREGERLEIISRHVNRAHRVMEAAAPGQILASAAVVEAARDFIDVPREHLALQHYGEFYLKGVGPTELCEVADLRFQKPAAPQLAGERRFEAALLGRLELAGYKPLGRLGEGASGVVYQAEQNATGQTVAVKVLSPALGEDPVARQRFSDEAARLKQLQLAGLVRILDERLDHQPPFFVMERVEGQPVDAALTGASPQRVATVFKEICLVLDRAHAAGLIHCDLKPGNILLRADGAPVLLDFGIAVLQGQPESSRLSSSSVLGTPAYLAPEIISGGERTPATDLYSLGVLLFKVLAGREPFQGGSVHEIIQAHLHEDPPLPATFRPDADDGLQRICLKALEKNPADRYADALEMAGDLDRVARGEVVHTRPSVYENLLFHRVRQHVGQVREWAAGGLLSAEETHGLLSAYEGLQRRGLPAVMEGRFYRLWQTAVYLGGWAVINGAVLWLVQHWSDLTQTQRLLLGSVPAVTAFALAGAMWKLQRFRLTFVALIVGILGVPLLTGVWLHEFKIAAHVPEPAVTYELFESDAGDSKLTNRQLLIMALASVLVAGAVMLATRTTTHSAQAVLAVTFLYAAALLVLGVKPLVMEEKWAALALRGVPLLLFTGAVAKWLLDQPTRTYQAPPWIYFTALLLMAILLTLARFSLKEWTDLRDERLVPASFLLFAVAGAIQAGLGLAARDYLRHRGRVATFAVIFVGLLGVLAGLYAAGDEWTAAWWAPRVFGEAVPAAHLALPLASLVITLLACRYQMLAFLLVGLAGFATSVHLLGFEYFADVAAWPKVLMAAGAVCFFTALWLELRRTRGHVIDDVIGQSRL
jgi:class 3 adenylate cyclase/predicted Ser/Thr protein kinase